MADVIPEGMVADPTSFEGVSPAPRAEQSSDAPAENPNARGHSPARDQREQQQDAAPERKFRLGIGEFTEQAITDALTAKAEADVKRQAVPTEPSGYQVKLPDSFVQPVGADFQFCEDDPQQRYGLTGAKNFAAKHGLDQSGFEELLSLHVATTFEGDRLAREFNAEQDRLLGEKGNERLGAVYSWMENMAGADGAKALMAGVVTARQVAAFEGLMQRVISQGGTQFTQSHRDNAPPDPGKISGYENMSFEQRRVFQMNQTAGKQTYVPPGGRRRG